MWKWLQPHNMHPTLLRARGLGAATSSRDPLLTGPQVLSGHNTAIHHNWQHTPAPGVWHTFPNSTHMQSGLTRHTLTDRPQALAATCVHACTHTNSNNAHVHVHRRLLFSPPGHTVTPTL
jgi:hypothetical protein